VNPAYLPTDDEASFPSGLYRVCHGLLVDTDEFRPVSGIDQVVENARIFQVRFPGETENPEEGLIDQFDTIGGMPGTEPGIFFPRSDR